jgi:hypothetical protein
MSTLSPDTQPTLDALRRAVAEALERKRRLGQYAVTWRDGGPVLAISDPPALPEAGPKSETGS